LTILLFRHRHKLKVDLGELQDETEPLSSFLRSSLKADVTSSGNKLQVDSKELSPQELKRLVSKFVYHRNLNNMYWVALEGSAVKVNKFKDVKKHEKRKKEVTPPSTIKHGW
jgi:hypothetical protein